MSYETRADRTLSGDEIQPATEDFENREFAPSELA